MGAPVLAAYDSSGNLLIQYAVGWPCAGVQSLLIYTFVVLIFLKKTAAPLSHKAAYFVFGALVTYFVNILRVVSIYLTYINTLSQGRQAALEAARVFHDFYGGLYSMAWIVAYPLIVVGSRSLWHRITSRQPKIRLLERSTQRENVSSSASGN
jgi:exosortase/archaeosortase family protein